jgi:uncharacterized caspase-like protein
MGKLTPSQAAQRALVVGVSDYPSPILKLPAVANDVREMAKLLASKNGVFTKTSVAVLTDKRATRQNILDGLRHAFAGASADETVFVYLAGHGSVEGGNYSFVAHDTNASSLSKTGVPLTEIKALFESTKSTRAFLWLDFCHSGGILARGLVADDLPTIKRALGVVHGQGKVIVAACTSSQSAYESSSIGHGLFTDALLRGLRGEAKSAQGEVTALSLYEFIDHQVANPNQQPVFLGEMAGRIVLMHYPDRSGATTTAKPTSIAKTNAGRTKRTGDTWIMLGDHFFLAQSVRHQSEGKLEVVVAPADGDEEAELAALRPSQYGGRSSLPFAVNNDAHIVRVDQVTTETKAGKQHWALSLTVTESGSSNPMTEVTANGIGPDEIARRRAGRILVNDPPPVENRRGYSTDSMLEGFIEGMGRYPVKECVVRKIYQRFGESSDWNEFARLNSVFMLKMTGTVEHVLELSIGKVQGHKATIKFRGRRGQRYHDKAATTIEISGSCPLD